MKACEIPRVCSGTSIKRLLAWIAAPICVCSQVAQADYESEILSESPIGYYRFNDSVATDDLDVAPNLGSLGVAAKGLYSTSIVHAVPGALAAASNTAGKVINNGMTVPFQPGLNNQGSFTVEAWLKPTLASTPGLTCAVSSVNVTSPRKGWLIYQSSDKLGFNFRTYNMNGTATAVNIDSGNGTDIATVAGTWYHVVALWDDSAKVGKIYINGVLKKTSTVVPVTAPASREYEANIDNSFTLGSRSDNAFAWSGDIDEPAYYPTALTDTQILDHYNNAINPAPATSYDALVLADSPAGYWRLGEPVFVPRTPPVALNQGSLGAAADGGYYAGSKNASTGPDISSGFLGFGSSNSSLSLQTANGYVGTALGLLNDRSAYTVSGWVKRGASKSMRGGYFGQNDLLEFGDAASGVNIEAWINARGQNIVTPFSFADNTWGFIALTADSTKTTLYLNGVQVGQLSGNLGSYGSNAYKFNIGGGGIFGTSGDFFRGEIDEVAVFDKALTANRVKSLYDTALGTVPPTADAPTVTPGNMIAEGKSYTLAADPSGSTPFTYQWYSGGVEIPGATGRTYTVESAVLQSPVGDPFEYTVKVSNGSGDLTTLGTFVYVTPVLQWAGSDASNPQLWDISVTPNWKPLGTNLPTTYNDTFSVLFDDTATSTLVDIQEDLLPQAVVFDHSTKDFTLAGSPGGVGIAGASGLTKSGTGKLTITASNIFTGPVVINGGIVEVASTDNLGDTTGSLTIDSAILHATATHDLPRKMTVPTTAEVVVDEGMTLGAPGGVNGGGILTKTGLGTLNFKTYGGGAFNGGIVVEEGTLTMSGSAFNSNLGIQSILIKSGASLFQPAGAAHAIGGGYSTVPPITLEQGSTYTANQENYLGVVNMTGASVQGTGDLRSDYGFQLNVLASSVMSTWANPLNGVVTPININVEDGPAVVDLMVSGVIYNTQPLNKTGAGTMSITGNGTISGISTISAGKLTGGGSLAGPLVIGSSATIAPGNSIGTFTAGDTTLSGTYLCEISGTNTDTLKVNGNLILSTGSAIQISASGATAPFYVICSHTGTLTDSGVSITGVPSGYEVRLAFNSIIIAQAGLDFAPVLAQVPGSASSELISNDFNSDNGSFTVSTPVSPETDWTYTAGSWTSTGQETGFGGNNLSYLTSPPFTLTKSGIFALSFSHRFSFEAGYDGGVVEVSINGGAYKRVAASAFTQNGYNVSLGVDAVGALVNQQAFGSDSPGHPGFITSACKAGVGNVGDIVTVRFMSASDNNTSGALSPKGWEIDSYAFSEGQPGGMTLTWPVGVMQYSDNLQPPWTDISETSPLFIDSSLAPRRFFRLKQ